MGKTQADLVALVNKGAKEADHISRQWLAKLETGVLKRDLTTTLRLRLAKVLEGDPNAYRDLPISLERQLLSTSVTALRRRGKDWLDRVAELENAGVVCRGEASVTMVGSPKGGVGRTLLLVHAALVHACGCAWAGIRDTFPLIIDADFNAPGVHNFPLHEASEWMGDGIEWKYAVGSEVGLTYSDLVRRLCRENIGLVFLLDALLKTDAFAQSQMKLASAEDLTSVYKEIVSTLSEVFQGAISSANDPLNPLNHVVTLVDGQGHARLAFIPAGSPTNPAYAKRHVSLRWSEHVADGIGLAVLEALLLVLQAAAKSGTGKFPLPQRIEQVFIDQSPGRSAAIASHQFFANQRLLVSSLGRQSREGLNSWIESMNSSDKASTWVNLTFYRGRSFFNNTPHSPGTHERGDASLYLMLAQATENFHKADGERAEALHELKDLGIAPEKIALTDFDPAILNRQTILPSHSPYHDAVVRLVVSMEQAKSNLSSSTTVDGTERDIRVVGEYVGNPKREEEAAPSGVLRAFCNWLQDRIGKKKGSARVNGVALSHPDLAFLVRTGQLKATRQKLGSYAEADSSLQYYKGDENGTETLKFDEFDIAAFPSYLLDHAHESQRIVPLDAATLPDLALTSFDKCGCLDLDYFAHVIRGWEVGCLREDRTMLLGVPLFSHPALIVSNKNKLAGSPVFRKAFSTQAHKPFASFVSFPDLLNAAIIGADTIQGTKLLMVTSEIPRVYDWLTVLGLLGHNPFGSGGGRLTIDAFTERLSSQEIFDATLHYALLDYLAHYEDGPETPIDWADTTRVMYDERHAGFMFVWPDAIPRGFLEGSSAQAFLYSPVPGVLQFEEQWMLTLPRKEKHDSSKLLWKYLIDFLRPESQRSFHDNSGIPVHQRVLSDPGTWTTDPICRALGLLRFALGKEQSFNIDRNLFAQPIIASLGELLQAFCTQFRQTTEGKQSSLGNGNLRNAVAIVQASVPTPHQALYAWWKERSCALTNQ